MTCNKCGGVNENGVTFCTTCGNNLQTQAQGNTSVVPAPMPTNYNQGGFNQGSFNQGGYNQGYNQGNSGIYGAQNANNTELEEPVSLKEWMVVPLFSFVPFLGLIMLFVWGFGGNAKKSKSNWAKAQLIWIGIAVAVYILLMILFVLIGLSVSDAFKDAFNEMYY